MKRVLGLVICLLLLSANSLCLAQGVPPLGTVFGEGLANRLKVSAGWVYQTPGIVVGSEVGGWSVPLQGSWLGGEIETQVTKDLGLVLTGANIFAQDRSGSNPVPDERVGRVQNIELWNVGGHAVYSYLSGGGLIGGFRWMQLQFEDWQDIVADQGGRAYGNHKLNAYIPLIGVQVKYDGLAVRAMGFPRVPSEYIFSPISGDWTAWAVVERTVFKPEKAFFVELDVEYCKRLYWGIYSGLFVRFTSFQGAFKTDYDAVFPPLGLNFSEPDVLLAIHVNHWAFGGNVSIPF